MNTRHPISQWLQTTGMAAFLGLSLGLATVQDAKAAIDPEIEIQADAYRETVQTFVEDFLSLHPGQFTLDQLSLSLTQALHHSGYPLASVAPAQNSNGEFSGLMVRLGEIKALDIQGLSHPDDHAQIHAIVQEYLFEQPAHQARLERATMLIEDLKGVRTQQHLQETEPGHFTLIVQATPSPASTTLQYDSLPPLEFYRHRISLTHVRSNLVKSGDLVRLTALTVTGDGQPSQLGGGLYYLTPVNAKGTFASLNVSDLRSRVEQGLAQPLDFDGQSLTLNLGHPVERNVHGYAYLTGQIQHTRELLEGLPRREVNLARLFYLRKMNLADASRLDGFAVVTAGSSDEPRAENFQHLRLGLGVTTPLHELAAGSFFQLDLFSQISNKVTPASERFYLGSTQFLRGYSFASESGDTGMLGSVTLGKTLWQTPSWVRSADHGVFLDAGMTRSENPTLVGNNKTLYSVGYRFNVALGSGFQFNGWLAAPLKANSAGEKPSPNLYFQLSQTW